MLQDVVGPVQVLPYPVYSERLDQHHAATDDLHRARSILKAAVDRVGHSIGVVYATTGVVEVKSRETLHAVRLSHSANSQTIQFGHEQWITIGHKHLGKVARVRFAKLVTNFYISLDSEKIFLIYSSA